MSNTLRTLSVFVGTSRAPAPILALPCDSSAKAKRLELASAASSSHFTPRPWIRKLHRWSTIASTSNMNGAYTVPKALRIHYQQIGPLELAQGLGFAPAIPFVAGHSRVAVILVVRPALVEAAAGRLAPRVARVEIVTRENRDILPRRLGEEILAALPR